MLDDVPEDLRFLFHGDAILGVSTVGTVVVMGISEIAGLGWNPLIVFGCIAGWLTAQAIVVHVIKRKG